MSNEAMAIALNHSQAKGTDRLVLLGIANHDGDGGSWPSLETLRKYAGNVDERTVRRSLRSLEALGEVRVDQNGGGLRTTRNDRRPNLYHFLLTCPEGCDRSRNHRSHDRAPTSARPSDGGTPVSERGDVGVRNGGTPTSPEPVLRTSQEGGGARPSVDAPSADPTSSPHKDLGGQPSTAPEPPPLYPDKCPSHQVDGYVPPCGGCGVARMTYQASTSNAVRQEVERVRRERAEENARRRRDIAECDACDDTGYRGTRVCDHNPEAWERSREAAQAVREQLERSRK